MKIQLALSLLLCCFLAPTLAHAQGDKSGGGGDIVVCELPIKRKGFLNRIFGKKPLSYTLFDVYEARVTSRGYAEATGKPQLYRDLELGGPNLSMIEKINLIRDEYSRIDPWRAEQYSAEATRIANDLEANEHKNGQNSGLAVLITHPLVNIDDSKEPFDLERDGCNKYQFARQEKPADGGPEYVFVRSYWKRIDRDNRVATIFHEVIYKEFRTYMLKLVSQGLMKYEDVNSRWARFLNSYLFSRKIGSYGLKNYLEFLNDHGPRSYKLKTNIGWLDIVSLVPARNFWSAVVTPEDYITDVTIEYSGVSAQSLQLDPLPLNKATHYTFNAARQLTGFKGVFGIAYDPQSKKVMDWNADCRTTPYLACVAGNHLAIEPGGRYRLYSSSPSRGSVAALAFDRAGTVYSN